MKAKLTKNGEIRVKAETIAEGFALKSLCSEGETNVLPDNLVLIDYSILDKKKKNDPVTER